MGVLCALQRGGVSAFLSLGSDSIIKFECDKLASIADDESLPVAIRSRAASLRDIAGDA